MADLMDVGPETDSDTDEIMTIFVARNSVARKFVEPNSVASIFVGQNYVASNFAASNSGARNFAGMNGVRTNFAGAEFCLEDLSDQFGRVITTSREKQRARRPDLRALRFLGS